jgi:UDP-N-acetyl-D-glucosamine dehydrogenase
VPVLPPLRGHSIRLESIALTPETLAAQDCVLIATDHAAFDWEAIASHAALLVDTRGATRKLPRTAAANIVTA